jgi:putative membrane protein
VAGLFTIAFKYIYQWITPYNEKALIREGNLAASIALAGALIGYVLPLASALSHTVSLPEFAAWAALAGVIQIAAFTGVRLVALPDVKARIENGETSIGIYLAGISIAVGVLNAACMTS